MSTILDALKKVEGEGQGMKPAEPNELDRQIVHGGASSIAKPVRRGAVVVIAVLVAAVAGAGVTMLGVSLWQGGSDANLAGEGTPAVSSSGEAVEGLEGVEVGGEVEEMIEGRRLAKAVEPANAEAREADALEAMPPSALLARATDPAAGRKAVVTATPSTDRETIVIPPPRGAENQLDPMRKLAARRQARVSGTPPARAPVEAQGRSAETKAEDVAAEKPGAAKAAAEALAASRPTPKPSEAPKVDRTPPAPVRETEAPPTPPGARERPPIEIVNIARVKQPAPPEASASPPEARTSAARVGVSSTVWHPYKSRRKAEITLLDAGEARLHTVRQGDSVGPYLVKEITPSGVTFLYEGAETQRSVGAAAR